MTLKRLGIVGGGQLGQMMALAGFPLGVRCTVLDPEETPPCAGVATLVRGSYDDPAALQRLASAVDAVTYEFENVPVAALAPLQGKVPLWPPPRALEVAQDRLTEKDFFNGLGIPTSPYAAVDSLAELQAAARRFGFPCILKTRRLGYDGKGQAVLRAEGDLAGALQELGGRGLILEGFVRFTRELSVLTVRSAAGDVRFYDLPENRHEGGILRTSLAPAPGLSAEKRDAAHAIARRTVDALGYVGVLAIELFDTPDGLVVNEMAPRVHNSGHWTIEGAVTSQFENHVRAVLGMPLGDTATRGVAGMLNLIGETPDAARLLAEPGAALHLYGKSAKPGRKLGHVTVARGDADEARGALDRLSRIR